MDRRKKVIKKCILVLAICVSLITFTACEGTQNVEKSENLQSQTGEITDYSSAKQMTLQKTKTIQKGGKYSVSGTISDGQLIVDTTEKVYLQFDGLEITNSSGAAFQVVNAEEVTVTLKAGTSNSLIDGGSGEFNAAMFTNDTLIVEGEGDLAVTGNQAHGIESDDDVIINGGNLSITAIKDAIHANNNVTVNGGEIQVATAYEGIESKGGLMINEGSLVIHSTDDALNAATEITINGGKIYANATKGDAVDSNGIITMAGGTLVAEGGTQPEGGIDCDQNDLNITGGTLIAIGGTNSKPTAETSTQYSVMLSGTDADTLLHLEGENGEIFTFQSNTTYQSMLFSSPSLQKDETYTMSTGGTVSGGDTFYGFSQGETYSGGTQVDSFTISEMVTAQGGNTGMGGGRGPGNGQMPPDGFTPTDGAMRPAGEKPQGERPTQEN